VPAGAVRASQGMPPKSKAADAAGGLPKRATVTGIVKQVFRYQADGPPTSTSCGSKTSRGERKAAEGDKRPKRSELSWFRVILDHVEEDVQGGKGVVGTPNGKAVDGDELGVAFLGSYADAAQHMQVGHRITVTNFAVDKTDEAPGRGEFGFDLTGDGTVPSADRSFKWEFKDKDAGVWKILPTQFRGAGGVTKDNNTDLLVKKGDELRKFLQERTQKPAEQQQKRKKKGAAEPEVYEYVKLGNLPPPEQCGPDKNFCSYAVIGDFSQPRETKGQDLVVTMAIFDETRPHGVKCSFLMADNRIPKVRKVGDIIRIHRFRLQAFQGNPQLAAVRAMVCDLITGEKPPAVRGPAGDADPLSVSGGVYQTGSTKPIDVDRVKELRDFSKKFLTNPSKFVGGAGDDDTATTPLGVAEYCTVIEKMKDDKPFDLYCQIVGFEGRDDPAKDFYCLQVRDGTELPQLAGPPQTLAAIKEAQKNKYLATGSILPVYISRHSKLHKVLWGKPEAAAPQTWSWVKLRNIQFQLIVSIDANSKVLAFEDYGGIDELPAYHFKVAGMLSRQDAIIEKGGASSSQGKAGASSSQASQGGKSAGTKRGAAKQDGGLSKRAKEAVTEPVNQNLYCGHSTVQEIKAQTEKEPISKFRALLTVGLLPDTKKKSHPEDLNSVVQYKAVMDRWHCSLRCFLKDDTGGIEVTSFGGDFEKLVGMKAEECKDDVAGMKCKLNKILKEGAVLDVLLKSYKDDVRNKIVYLLYDTRIK